MSSDISEANLVIRTSWPTMPTPAEQSKQRPTIIVYATVAPETVVIPIVSCILGFPLLVLLVICCLRRRAKLARQRERRRALTFGGDPGAMSLLRLSPVHRLGVYLAGPTEGRNRAYSIRSERAMSRTFASLELDPVAEERSDPEFETTAVDVTGPDR